MKTAFPWASSPQRFPLEKQEVSIFLLKTIVSLLIIKLKRGDWL
jgi:hypothetical protein